MQNGDILVPTNPGPPGKWPLKRTGRQQKYRICKVDIIHKDVLFCFLATHGDRTAGWLKNKKVPLAKIKKCRSQSEILPWATSLHSLSQHSNATSSNQ